MTSRCCTPTYTLLTLLEELNYSKYATNRNAVYYVGRWSKNLVATYCDLNPKYLNQYAMQVDIEHRMANYILYISIRCSTSQLVTELVSILSGLVTGTTAQSLDCDYKTRRDTAIYAEIEKLVAIYT